MKKFKENIYPHIKKHGFNVVLYSTNEWRNEIEDISSKAKAFFSIEELNELNRYFETVAGQEDDRALSSLIFLFGGFVVLLSLKLVFNGDNPIIGALALAGLVSWVIYGKYQQNQQYLRIAAINVIRDSLGMGLISWNQFTNRFDKSNK